MDREFEEVARRVEARAFLYGDPGSFRDGVRAAVRELEAVRAGERRDPRLTERRPSHRAG
ncbi:MAG: hypothetical protein ACJ77A_02490 [Actinomycetota bacterium]